MEIIDKPWGREELLEHNDRYVVKKLVMNAGHKCSIQYHEKKMETVYVLKGSLKLFVGKDIDNLEEKILSPGEYLTLEPYVVHRMEAVEDSEYLEASTPELEDVVRLKDEYGR